MLYWLVRAGGVLAKVLPLQLSYVLAARLGDLVYLIWRKKRWIARRNYAQVLDARPDAKAVAKTARAAFQNYAKWVLELLHLPALDPDTLRENLIIHGMENLEAALALNKGVIFVSAHFGSLELGVVAMALLGHKVMAVADTLKPEKLMNWVVASRTRFGVTMVPVEKTLLKLFKALRQGQLVALVVDVGGNSHQAISVDFFGRPAPFPIGAAALARWTGAPILPGYVLRLPDRRFQAVALPPILPRKTADAEDDIRAITQAVANALESFIRAHPEQWYMFRPMWPP